MNTTAAQHTCFNDVSCLYAMHECLCTRHYDMHLVCRSCTWCEQMYVLAINSTTTGKMFAAYLDLSAPVTSYNSHMQLIDSAAKEIAMKSQFWVLLLLFPSYFSLYWAVNLVLRCLKSCLDPSQCFEQSLDLSRPAKNLSWHNTLIDHIKSQSIKSHFHKYNDVKSLSYKIAMMV